MAIRLGSLVGDGDSSLVMSKGTSEFRVAVRTPFGVLTRTLEL